VGVALVAALVRPLGGQPVRHLPLDRRGGESAQVVLVPLPRFQRQRSRVGRNDEHCEEKQTQQHGGSRSVLVLSPAQGQPGPRHPLGFAGTAEHKHHLPAVQPHPAPRRQGETATALAHVILQLHSAPVHPKRAAHLRRHVHQIVLAPGGDQRQRGAANHFLRHRRVGVRGGADHVLCRPRTFACAAGLVQVVGGDELAAEKRLDFQSIALEPKLIAVHVCPCRDGGHGELLALGSRAAVTFPHTRRAGAARVPVLLLPAIRAFNSTDNPTATRFQRSDRKLQARSATD
jgi:hypothetical protein